jgi:hypothetical protein
VRTFFAACIRPMLHLSFPKTRAKE